MVCIMGDENGQEGIILDRLLPSGILLRVKSITRSETLDKALRILCDSGFIELSMILIQYVTGLGDTRTMFSPVNISSKPESCSVRIDDNTLYYIVKASGEYYCTAIDNYKDMTISIVRPCSIGEIDVTDEKEDSVEAVFIDI